VKKYRVWTKDWDGGLTVLTDWETRNFCRKVIVGRWGHWPPFAFISQAKSRVTFMHANGV
jgi:hypothetical protein